MSLLAYQITIIKETLVGILESPNAKSQSKYCCPIDKSYLGVASFSTHDIFHLDARNLERMRGCVAIFTLVAVYGQKRGSFARAWLHVIFTM